MVLIVAYDLHNPGRDYDDIAAVLKGARSWKHPQGSVWFLDTDGKPKSWVDKLRAAGDANDEFFVCRLSENWWSFKLDEDAADWLKSSQRTW